MLWTPILTVLVWKFLKEGLFVLLCRLLIAARERMALGDDVTRIDLKLFVILAVSTGLANFVGAYM